jgi:tRNA G18 (ribose-2'-O)-methylase SpoU
LIHEVGQDDDPRLEPYRHVGDAAWLRARGLFVAEGRLVSARLIEIGAPVESVLVTPPALAAFDPALLAACTVYVAPPSIVTAVTGFNFHRGCLALARRWPPRPLVEFAAARRLVILEGVNNPDNVGGIFRSAAALGADGVLLGPGSGDPLYRKAVRTSMGAALWLPFAEAEPWPDALRTIREMGFVIAALSPSGAVTLERFASTVAPDSRIALLAGAEGAGLSGEAMAAAAATVCIPVDPRSDSLNVVVAVSIVLARLR